MCSEGIVWDYPSERILKIEQQNARVSVFKALSIDFIRDLKTPCIHLISLMLETSFDKDTTCQSKGMGIRKISKNNEDTSENNKMKTG